MIPILFNSRGGGAAAWTPGSLLTTPTVWVNPKQAGTVLASNGGAAVTADGGAVGQILDLSGNGNHLTQPTAGSRMTLDTATDVDGIKRLCTVLTATAGGGVGHYPLPFSYDPQHFTAYIAAEICTLRPQYVYLGDPNARLLWDTCGSNRIGRTNSQSDLPASSRRAVFWVRSTPAGITYGVNGTTSSLQSATVSDPQSGGQLFDFSDNGYAPPGSLFEFLMFAGAGPSDADHTLLLDYLYRVNGIATSAPTVRLLTVGDSIVSGFFARGGRGWARKTLAYLPAGAGLYCHSRHGITAATLSGEMGNVSQFYSGSVPCVAVVSCGVNDIYGGATAASVQSSIQSICTALQGQGWAVAVTTVMYGFGFSGATETARQAVNTWIRNNYGTFADGLIDLDADSRLQSGNVTYFSDGTHPNDAGHDVAASLIGPVAAGLV